MENAKNTTEKCVYVGIYNGKCVYVGIYNGKCVYVGIYNVKKKLPLNLQRKKNLTIHYFFSWVKKSIQVSVIAVNHLLN